MKLGFIFSLLMLLVGCADQGSWSNSVDDSIGQHVIYGEDSLRDPNLADEGSQSLATVAFVHRENDEIESEGVALSSVEEMYPVDKKYKYSEESSASFCSGVIIGKNKILTAAHCFEEISCEDTVVHFRRRNPVNFDFEKTVKRECKSVKKRTDSATGIDYAIVEFKKSVEFKAPKISQNDVRVGQELYVLGHPLGIYQKYASGVVRKFDNKANIVANLDVFEGNSGSPVFAKDSGELIGIYSAGESDFMTDVNGNERMVRCSDTGCGGEIVIPIKKIIEDMANQQ